MRILHICSGTTGGARLAADRLVSYQNKNGFESELLVIDNGNSNFKNSPLHTIMRKANTLISLILTRKPYGVFSTNSISSIGKSVFQYDVINVHNWFNLLSPADFIYLNEFAPLVFTLHDERLLTGGCHNTLGCSNYLKKCINCPGVRMGSTFVNHNKSALDNIFRSLKCYGVASPSRWLLEKAKDQELIINSRVSMVIPNIISHIPIDPKVRKYFSTCSQLIFIASDISDPRKGFSILVEALNLLVSSGLSFHLNIIGNGTYSSRINFPHTFYGFLDEQKIQKLLAKSQLCIVPSTSENLPSVIFEAIAGNVLVLATPVGGVNEIIIDQETGFLVEANSSAIHDYIKKILNMNDFDLNIVLNNARQKMKNVFSNESVNESYLQLYNSLLEC
jgi:glycosyltransferase involved in cell wall biosynthesis